jgi:pimeloyl-ACP methyl ester carboxylesterase
MKKTIKAIVTVSATAVGVIHILNRISFSLNTVKDYAAKNNAHDYEWRFGKVHYTKKGSGAPLLLIHNLTPGSSSYEFHSIIDSLAEKNEVYAIDLLGYGSSEKCNMTYTNYLYVQLITDFIKNVIGRKTSILTSGDSSSIAVMTCHNDPDIINQLLFINPQSLYQSNQIPTKQTKLLKLLVDVPVIGTLVYNMQTSKKAIYKKFEQDYFFDADFIDEHDIEAYCESAHTKDYKVKYAISSYLGRYMNINILHAIKEINNNIIIFSGDAVPDQETITENYHYYNHSIETVTIKEAKLLPHLEKPEEFLSTLSLYLI